MTENWKPYMELRHDASDEQIQHRCSYLAIGWKCGDPMSIVTTAREFGAAVDKHITDSLAADERANREQAT
jgi:hypothetical protein